MSSIIQSFIQEVTREYISGQAREHSYRPALKNLIENIDQTVQAINEPKRQEVGAPDFILNRKNVPVGFIEAKDIDITLDAVEKSEQIKRYQGLGNLLLTNCLEFRFYQFETKVATVTLGKLENGKMQIDEAQFKELALLIKNFLTNNIPTITSAKVLAKIMADKAKVMREVIYKALLNPIEEKSALHEQFEAFKQVLLHDLTIEDFADIYAQTITYGLFAARYNDTTVESFSRQEAEYLLPKSNPFLRKFFHHIAGPDLDDRIVWIVDALADVFNHCDLYGILKNFGKTTQRIDPVLHFYETFLAEYDPKLRKARGVYYTPEPVVNFIVRAVDHLLKNVFELRDGLKDTSMVEIDYEGQGKTEKERKQKMMVHKVQVLDPATGTGTFLNEVIKHIHEGFAGQQGIWSQYVEKHLLPRIHGFELMMAPYTIAHLKLGMFLRETGYQGDDQRLGVYLTNSLNEFHPDTNTIFASWLSHEANAANHIKKNIPIMVVLGNPPYSVSSNNNDPWIQKLVADYKTGLNEKNIQPLSDDYVKFIRYAQHCIQKKGTGIVAMITNNSFLDGVIHRQMRKSLLETFDSIYIYDLHGNAKKKEVAPDGGKDENVFDIMQGVSISIFVKTSDSKEDAILYHLDSYGKREVKYEKLWDGTLRTAGYKILKPQAPYWFFVPKDFGAEEKYEKGIKVDALFPKGSSGVTTSRDDFVIDYNKEVLKNRIVEFYTSDLNDNEIKSKYQITEIGKWSIHKARGGIFDDSKLEKITYRPFDDRYVYYSLSLVDRPREEIMKHMFNDNIGFIAKRGLDENHSAVCFITKFIIDRRSWSRPGMLGAEQLFPLYLYPETDSSSQSTFEQKSLHRVPNLDLKIVEEIAKKLGLTFSFERSQNPDTFCPEDILDYIYAVLHSPTYRQTYKEFLKIDFPRVPFIDDRKLFFQMVAQGKALRELHLLTSPLLDTLITQYPMDGSNLVEKISYEADQTKGKVFINKDQYFADVPKIAWEFYVGGYQPAQKWLKDRKGRTLSFDDILHYQKMIVALAETDRLMKDIDMIAKPLVS